jgi:uncharacterized protein involved in exopolysaccharide biosynthesis
LSTDLHRYIDILNRWKGLIVGVIGTVAVASVVLSFFLPKWYAAQSTLLPPPADASASLTSIVQGFTLPGFGNVGPRSPEAQLFLAILDSRNLRDQLIEKYDLQTVYKVANPDDALGAFSRLARCGFTDRGIVQVTVEDRDPARAAAIANDWVKLLDEYNKNARMTAGRRTRIFVERRLDETRQALQGAADSLAAYQAEHKNLALSPELSTAVSASASVIAQRMALDVRLSYLRDLYKGDNPQVAQAEAELAALDRQIAALPPVAMEFARRVRELKVQEQVYTLLVAQYEEARIRENKDIPTLDVLDVAVPPQRRIRPVRWLFCTSLTLAAAVLTLGTVFGVEYFRRQGRSPQSGTFAPPGRVGRSA